jgi:hypothetical protein
MSPFGTKAEVTVPFNPRGQRTIRPFCDGYKPLPDTRSVSRQILRRQPLHISTCYSGPDIRVPETLIPRAPLPARLLASDERVNASGPRGQWTTTIRPEQFQVPLFPFDADEFPSGLSVTTALSLSHLHIQEPATLSQGDPVAALAEGFLDWILRDSSPPEIDLSVLPILPPVLPGCNCATQGTESIPMKKMDKMKRCTGIPHRPDKVREGSRSPISSRYH